MLPAPRRANGVSGGRLDRMPCSPLGMPLIPLPLVPMRLPWSGVPGRGVPGAADGDAVRPLPEMIFRAPVVRCRRSRFGRVRDGHAVELIRNRVRGQRVSADAVAVHDVVVTPRASRDAAAGIPGDDVAGAWRRAADGVVVGPVLNRSPGTFATAAPPVVHADVVALHGRVRRRQWLSGCRRRCCRRRCSGPPAWFRRQSFPTRHSGGYRRRCCPGRACPQRRAR